MSHFIEGWARALNRFPTSRAGPQRRVYHFWYGSRLTT